MRPRVVLTAAGLWLAPLVALSLAHGKDPAPGQGQLPKPGIKLVVEGQGTCGKHGTQVEFVENPKEAARLAKKKEKLVFVLHISGIFEDPKLT
jgi:hypothetical protein